jgi:hypothetical protein
MRHLLRLYALVINKKRYNINNSKNAASFCSVFR